MSALKIGKKYNFGYFVKEIWWKNFVLNGEHKQSTIDYYRSMSRRILVAFEDTKITNITSLEIEAFLSSLIRENLSPATRHHHRRILTNIFNYAHRHDIIEKNPMNSVAAIKPGSKRVEFLAPDQAFALIAALKEAPKQWQCMITIYILAGLRRGEAVALQWKDIDFDAGLLSVSKAVTYSKESGTSVGTPKTEAGIRVLPLSQAALDQLKDWKQYQEQQTKHPLPAEAYIFPGERGLLEPMHPHTPTRWLRRFLKKRDLPNVSPHDLRHTCGALMLASGEATVKDTQEFLGHEDASTTLRFYAGTTPETLRKAATGLETIIYSDKKP